MKQSQPCGLLTSQLNLQVINFVDPPILGACMSCSSLLHGGKGVRKTLSVIIAVVTSTPHPKSDGKNRTANTFLSLPVSFLKLAARYNSWHFLITDLTTFCCLVHGPNTEKLFSQPNCLVLNRISDSSPVSSGHQLEPCFVELGFSAFQVNKNFQKTLPTLIFFFPQSNSHLLNSRGI